MAEFHVGVGVDGARGLGAALGEREGKRVGDGEDQEVEKKGIDLMFRGAAQESRPHY